MDLLVKSTVCRACLEEDSILTSINKTYGNRTYRNMLISFCKIQMSDDNDMLCDKCIKETIRCYDFKIKCEQSDNVLQSRIRNVMQYNCEENDIKIAVNLATLKTEQEDNIFLDTVDIKSERDETSSDDDKDEVLSLATKFGVKTLPKRKENEAKKLKIKSKKEDKVLKDDKRRECVVLDDWKKSEKGVSKRGRKRKKPKKEENQLTEDGFKKIYVCPKCFHFCKSFIMMARHFSNYHQINLENHAQYKEIITKTRMKENSLNKSNCINKGTKTNAYGIDSPKDEVVSLNKIIESAIIIDNSVEISNADKTSCVVNTDESRTTNESENLTDSLKLSQNIEIESNSHSEKNEILSAADRMKLYKCIHCDYTNKIYDQMRSHILKHKQDKYIRCEDCNFRCSDVRHLRGHSCIYGNTTSHCYQCEECGHSTTSKTLLRTHHASKHSHNRPYACHLCHFTTKLRTGLTQHIQRRHEKRKNFSCPTCDKKFFSGYHMRIHALTHGGDKQHVCEHCGARFIQKSNLLKHVEVMHSSKSTERPFGCVFCSYKARVPQTLAKHLLTHTGQKPNACHLCPFTCISSTSLQLHILRHKGEKKFSCSACSYKCYSRDRLRAHERVHSGERPFACTQCPYRAKTKQRLKNHNRSHENDQKYYCENCPYTANYRSNLIQHIKKNCGRVGRRYNVPQLTVQQTIPATQQGVETSSEMLTSTQTIDNNVIIIKPKQGVFTQNNKGSK